MTHKPYSLDEATEIAEDFEDLIDTDFTLDKTITYVVDNVVAGPFNEDSKELFVKNYLKTKNAEESLNFYDGKEFDVLLFAYDENDDTSFICIDIRTFTEQKGIRYNFP
jgi:hypothetical protein